MAKRDVYPEERKKKRYKRRYKVGGPLRTIKRKKKQK